MATNANSGLSKDVALVYSSSRLTPNPLKNNFPGLWSARVVFDPSSLALISKTGEIEHIIPRVYFQVDTYCDLHPLTQNIGNLNDK